jgi:hypothetical protein
VNDGIQTLRVYEIDQNTGFGDTLYSYSDPASDFATVGPELGSATFAIKDLKNIDTLIRAGDTSFVSNVVRIRLDNSLGVRFAQYDTIQGDKMEVFTVIQYSKLFFADFLKADPTGNALSYFSLTDFTNTRLTVYFTHGTTDTSSLIFII